ncbi:MAG: multiheme c-type cytochrome [Nitrospiraceae bacterium]|nr:multiheme c-type cytochrome [Nitrospiraceae bacterium]
MRVERKVLKSMPAIAAVLLALLLGACGADKPQGGTVATVAGSGTSANGKTVYVEGATNVGLEACTTCHPAQTAAWLVSRHGNSNAEPAGTESNYAAACKACHEPNGEGSQSIAGVSGMLPRVGCEACHGGGSLHAGAGGTGPIGYAAFPEGTMGVASVVPVSGQFRTCTKCHQLLDPTDPANLATTSTPHGSSTTSNQIITDTHFATPGNFPGGSGANTKNITGYAMDFASEKVCTDCHNPHGTADINREWALSAHADKLAAKDALGYFSTAWAHYNWTLASRAVCQRCHTTTGYAAYADAFRNGDPAGAAAIRLGATPPLQPNDKFKPEMLKCNGCHTDNRGTLRNPGPVTANYDYPIPVGAGGKPYALASYTFPDVSNSNVCMLCHTARENGDTLKGLNDPALLSAGTISAFDFSKNGFVNSHYLSAGGTVFTATGFEFPERPYENISTYRHVLIGSSAVPNTGTSGPCVGCHMSRPAKNGNHLFLPVTRDTVIPGKIDNIASQVCIYCHTESGDGGLAGLINERKEEYEASIEAVTYIIDKRGFYFREANPYFFQLRTAGTATITALVTQGSATVIGNGTRWVSAPTGTVKYGSSGDYFKADNDGIYYQVKSVASDTTLTLASTYKGTDDPAAAFTIISSSATQNWLTKKGSGIVPAAATDTDTTGAATGKFNMAAAFNLNLLAHEPGGYVHNRYYVKRLLYDAIDWADDNEMNYSVGATLNALPSGALFKQGAITYLLPYGTLGIAAERP